MQAAEEPRPGQPGYDAARAAAAAQQSLAQGLAPAPGAAASAVVAAGGEPLVLLDPASDSAGAPAAASL